MADYKDKIDEWQKTVRRKARELDEKYAISDLMDEGTKAAGDAAKRGAESLSSGADKLRAEAERFAEEGNLSETARRAADDAVRGAKKAGGVIRDAAGDAGKKPATSWAMQRTITIGLRRFTTPARNSPALRQRQLLGLPRPASG